jgi:hypothetical protein
LCDTHRWAALGGKKIPHKWERSKREKEDFDK